MVQDRCILSIKVEQEVICALSNGYVANDLVYRLIVAIPSLQMTKWLKLSCQILYMGRLFQVLSNG